MEDPLKGQQERHKLPREQRFEPGSAKLPSIKKSFCMRNFSLKRHMTSKKYQAAWEHLVRCVLAMGVPRFFFFLEVPPAPPAQACKNLNGQLELCT